MANYGQLWSAPGKVAHRKSRTEKSGSELAHSTNGNDQILVKAFSELDGQEN